MSLHVKARMNIVRWMATDKDDGAWDSRELEMARLGALRKGSDDTYTKTGVRFLVGEFNDPKAKFIGDAKDELFRMLTEEMGVDPAKLTGADKTQSLRDFEKLGHRGRFEFLKRAYAGEDGFETRRDNFIEADVVRDRVSVKTAEMDERADEFYRGFYLDNIDPDIAGYSLGGALEDDYGSLGMETIEKNGEVFGYAYTWSHHQGEMADTMLFDNRGRFLGEIDTGV